MRSALVLNATYEPLSVVSARRAICLVLCDKADVVADDGTEIHSEKLSMAGPIVIRLRYVVKVPYHRHTAMSRRAVFARDNHRCGYCGETADSIDHVGKRHRRMSWLQFAQTRQDSRRSWHAPFYGASRSARNVVDYLCRSTRTRGVEAVLG
jgi:5-methylcytosine-specific restriction endonuclease McrA